MQARSLALAVILASCASHSPNVPSDGAIDSPADAGSDAAIGSGSDAIAPALFGLHVRNDQAPWPGLSFATARTLGPPQSTWGLMNTAAGTYDWTFIDAWIADAQAHGFDIVFTLIGTPTWASSNPTDTTCEAFMQHGGCDAPDDLAADGTGTDQHLRDFMRDLATHANGAITYWETWNEPNLPSGGMWHGTTAQLVRMAQDMSEVVKGIDPDAKILTPGAASSTAPAFLGDFLASGGGAYIDIIAFHGYTQQPEAIVTQVGAIRAQMLTNGVATKPLWDTEASWGLDWLLPDPDEQRGFLGRFYALHASLGVERLLWFGWGTGMYDPTMGSHTTGTLWDTIDGPRPAATAYGAVQGWLVGATLDAPCAATGAIWTCNISRAGGYHAQLAWDAASHCSNGTCQASSYQPDPSFHTQRNLDGTTQPLGGGTAQLTAVPVMFETP